jgi:FkbM family methyltransferase
MSKMLYQLIGKNSRLIPFYRTLRINPIAFNAGPFGKITRLDEILNLHDNFGRGELRFTEIENDIIKGDRPVIIDCGVNVGITVRWWTSLNSHAKVIGVDMIQEAHDFTLEKLELNRKSDYIPITAALAASSGSKIEISFDDPLFGENSISANGRKYTRTVLTKTIDDICDAEGVSEVNLMKIDIEGYGAEALKGALNTIPKTRYIAFETHSKEEISESSAQLIRAGFEIIGMKSRTLFYRNTKI